MVDRGFSLSWTHTAFQHRRLETGSLESPFHQLQHTGKLTENDALYRMRITSEVVQLFHKGLDFGARPPVVHIDAVNNGVFLDKAVIYLDCWLGQVDVKSDVAFRAFGVLSRKTTDILLDTQTAEYVVATRFNGFLDRKSVV